MMLAFVRVAPGASILALLVLAAIVLAGLVGLALLVIGLVKRWPGMWIGGIVVMLIAGLVLAAGVAAAFVVLPRACTVSPGPRGSQWPAPDIGPPGAGPAEDGDYVRHSGDHGAARVEGVDFEVIQPGSGASRSSSSHSSGIGGSESKHELAWATSRSSSRNATAARTSPSTGCIAARWMRAIPWSSTRDAR